MVDVINWFIDKVALLGEGVTAILPRSPFTYLNVALDAKWLGYINYFLPVSEVLNILVAWGAAILLWYAYQILLRWVKAVR